MPVLLPFSGFACLQNRLLDHRLVVALAPCCLGADAFWREVRGCAVLQAGRVRRLRLEAFIGCRFKRAHVPVQQGFRRALAVAMLFVHFGAEGRQMLMVPLRKIRNGKMEEEA
ncbi:MAG: hypothetical protein ACK4LQ_06045 [Pararhodobacter sp.]